MQQTSPTPNDEQQPARTARPGLIVCLVSAAFVLPVLLAWWLARDGGPALGGARTNHGAFIAPPLDIAADSGLAALDTIELGPGEWAMIVYGAGHCDAPCRQALGSIASIHRVLGHDGTRVRLVLVSDAATDAEPAVRNRLVDANARALLAKAGAAARADTAADGIVFLDWRGQVMMTFAADAPPGDVKQDLKRLLRGSKTG